MKYWLITDTHFNHIDKMQEFCGRPLNYEELIFKGLSRIPKDDILIHLGDICIGEDAQVHAKYIQPLECRKILVRGNHDKKTNSWYLSNGWDFVVDSMLIEVFGKRILFSHKPQQDLGYFDINIHGHFHNSNRREEEFKDICSDKHKLLAIEYTKYMPTNLDPFINKP